MTVERDKTRIRHSFAAAAETYDAMAELQRQVGCLLLQRFPLTLPSGCLLDLGSGTGFLAAQLAVEGGGNPLVMDIALPMLQASRRKYPGLPMQRVCADAEKLPLRSAAVEQIYSNLAFQWLQTPATTFADFKRVLTPNGRLVFSTFGPDTLKELKAAWASVDDRRHVNRFFSVDEIVKQLRIAGFYRIDHDSKPWVRDYPSVLALMRELKGLGAHHVNQSGQRKLTTKSELQKMMDNYQSQSPGSGIAASYDILLIEARV